MQVRLNSKATARKSSGFGFAKLMLFFQTNWVSVLVVTVLALLTPYFYRYFRSQSQLNDEQDVKLAKDKQWLSNLNSETKNQRANKITKSVELHIAAEKLAIDLGTKYSDKNSMFSILDPRGWTENDSEALTTLLKYRNYYTTLKRLYHDCYSNSRDLETDILELLDEKELKRLRQVLKI